LADWYVYQHDGDPLGPWSTDEVANSILAGKLAPDVWVAAPGGPRWLRALDVPVIGRLVEGIPTRPRRDSGLRLIPGAFSMDGDLVSFGSTMMIVKDDEFELAELDAPALSKQNDEAAPPTARSHSLAPSLLNGHQVTGTEDTVQVNAAVIEAIIEDAPPTDPAMPPESTTPSLPPAGRPAPVVAEREAASSDRRRRRKGA
jgi:hypothetical protein